MAEKRIEITVKQDDGEVRSIGFFHPSDHTLYVRRKKSKHFYRILSAWGIDYLALMGLIGEQGLEHIVLYDIENKKTYRTEAQQFLENGKTLHFKPYRLQVFLSEEYWKVD